MVFSFRFSSIMERSNMSLDKDPEFSDVTSARSGRTSPYTSTNSRYTIPNPGIPPPSPMSSLRRSSTADVGNTSSLRHSSTADVSNTSSLRRSSTNEATYSQPYTNSLRRSSTHERQPLPDYSRSNSLSRNESFHNGNDYSSGSLHSETPNYSRYSSLLDDKHDWGFRTLKRRNSKAGSKMFPNDDIKF